VVRPLALDRWGGQPALVLEDFGGTVRNEALALGEIVYLFADSRPESFVYEHFQGGQLVRKLVWFAFDESPQSASSGPPGRRELPGRVCTAAAGRPSLHRDQPIVRDVRLDDQVLVLGLLRAGPGVELQTDRARLAARGGRRTEPKWAQPARLQGARRANTPRI